MDFVVEQLGVPRKYLKHSTRENRIVAVVHRTWLRSLLKYNNLVKFIENEQYECWPYEGEDLGSSWIKIFITVYNKYDEKVIPLPRVRSVLNRKNSHLSFFQLLHYVMQSNHKNLWKDSYKKYTAAYSNKANDSHITLTDYNTVLREIITRTYGCPLINTLDSNLSMPHSKYFEAHKNILPAVCAIETLNSIFLIHIPHVAHNLQDCVMFSPAILDNSHTKPLFIIYQLLQTLLTLHDRSLTIGDITLNDIYLTDNLWVHILPRLNSNLHVQDVCQNLVVDKSSPHNTQNYDCRQSGHMNDHSMKCVYCGKKCYDKIALTGHESIAQLCELWAEGLISNFTYLTALNEISGRKHGEPNNHYVFPWVTDFTSRCGNNWRDLTKSKFRLNKGDRQLDLTYESSQSHVSDVLSSITYYVYMARRTPKSILCKNVRTIWVPAEYPSSIQRLQEWTPDECIPEFFTDPSVFKSIHEDLNDLEVPPWSSSPEDFVEKHREALESQYVSEKLHHWIDLTFGYKLSGSAAIKSKNVCLQLVDGHKCLTDSGVVQLFTQPHPTKMFTTAFTGKTPPKIHMMRSKRRDRSNSSLNTETQRQSEEEDISSGIEDDPATSQQSNRSPLVISRLLSRSRTSLNSDEKETSTKTAPSSSDISKNIQAKGTHKLSPNLGPKYPTFTSHLQNVKNPNLNQTTTTTTTAAAATLATNPHLISVPKSTFQSNVIYLPKEYNPAAALIAIESHQGFLAKTFHTDSNKFNLSSFNFYDDKDKHSIKEENLQHNEHQQQQQQQQDYLYNIESSQQLDDTENSFTNKIFTENFEASLRKDVKLSKSLKTSNSEYKTKMYENMKTCRKKRKADVQSNCNYKQIVASCRMRELQILGCLIVEIFLSKQLRPQGPKLSFNDRLKLCLTVFKFHGDSLPRCVKYAVTLLLQVHLNNDAEGIIRYPSVTDLGLPPPSAHQLLQPLLSSIFPFPSNFCKIYSFLSTLQEYSRISNELNVLYHFDCDGEMCSKYENIERTKILFTQNIGECKVKFCAKQLEILLFDTNADCSETVNILLPYVKEIIEDPSTSVLAAWYLFDPIARALGPVKTTEHLLLSILKLYENEQSENSLAFNCKIAKLYHHSFLLCLIVRLGLRTFLDNFITPLVEAVGGYKDYERSDIILHNHAQKLTRKTSHLKTIDDTIDLENLSPLDEESSADSEKNLLSPVADSVKDITDENEPEVFEFETEEKLSTDNVIQNLEQNLAKVELDFNHSTAEEVFEENILECSTKQYEDFAKDGQLYGSSACPKSPTIPIPCSYHQTELITIDCDVGSKKSEKYVKLSDNPDKTKMSDIEQPSTSTTNVNVNVSGVKTEERKAKRNNTFKISDMSADTLIWLSHRLGPVLTARFLSRNLLRMLTLCYVGKENMEIISKDDSFTSENIDSVSISNWRIKGDKNASKVLYCLVSIAALYGEQLILLQYLPHMSELISLCKRKLTPNLEGGLISCMALLKHIIPYLIDSTLMDQLQDEILKNILHPTVRLLGTTKFVYPSGSIARNVLARKYLDTLYVLALRIGADMSRTNLAVPALQRFFLIFNKVHGDFEAFNNDTNKCNSLVESPVRSVGEHYIEVKRDGTTTEWAVRGRPFQISQLRVKDSDSADSFSPPPVFKNTLPANESVAVRAMDELKEVFSSELAHTAFVPFLHYLGTSTMELSLKNHILLRDLCFEYEQEIKFTNRKITSEISCMTDHSSEDIIVGSTGSFGSNVALIGNRIDVQINESASTRQSHILNLVSNKIENTNRHLRQNWLAYWEHEIGRAEKDTMFYFKQIKLQSFNGHTNTIKAIQSLDNENSFMSGSKDKTVKLWSLRSQGDGTTISQCQSTYTGHKKSVLSVTFLESLRVTASCDSVVHIWDPFLGSPIAQLEGSRTVPVSMLKSMPAPSTTLLAATDTTVRLIDARTCSYIHELKVALNPVGLVRCLTVSPSGNWLAVGHSSGSIVVLDTRTGLVQASWKAHDGELLQLAPVGEYTLISSSLDQAVSVWNVNDGKLKFNMNFAFARGATEPVHCLQVYNSELISGTTANRIGVHTSVDVDASFSSTRLRSDTFKGVLTSMALLPLNRLLLLGADSGNISLLC